MATSLLTKSLGEVKNQEKPNSGRRGGGSSGGNNNRNSPYARPAVGGWEHDKYASTVDMLPSQRLDRSGRERRSPKLVITNLHYEVSERELELLFLQIGPLAIAPKIRFDRSGRSTGMAHVVYTSEEDASKAKEAFNGAPAKGENIKVEFDFSRSYVPPAPGTLLARLEQESRPKRETRSTVPRNTSFTGTGTGGKIPTGPKATRDSASSTTRGGRGGAGATRGGGAGGRGGKKVAAAKVPTTTGDLDKELEDFLTATPVEAEVAAAVAVGGETSVPEVEMS